MPRPPLEKLSDRRLALTLYAAFLGVYLLTMGGHFYSIDDTARFDLMRGILEEGTVEIPPTFSASHVTHDGRVFCKYGLGRPLATIPLYYLGKTLGPIEIPGFTTLGLEFWLSLFDQLLTPLLLVFLYFIVRRLGYRKTTAFFVAMTGGGATMLWMMSKYSFEHTLDATLCAAVILLLLQYRERPRLHRLVLAGLALGWMALTRIVDFAGLAPAFSIYVVYLAFAVHGGSRLRRLGRLAAFAAPIAICLAVVLAYNYYRFNDFFEFGYDDDAFSLGTAYVALIGYTVSPGKGMLVFSPVLLLLFWSVKPFFRKSRAEAFLLAGLVVGLFGLYVQHLFWHGDWCMGPRFLTPLMPPLLVFLAAFFERPEFRARPSWRVGAGLLLAAGFVIQLSCAAIDFNAWCARYQLDLNGARFYPAYSPVIQNWSFIASGETSLWFRDLLGSAAAWPVKLLILIPLGLLLSSAPRFGAAKKEILGLDWRIALVPARWRLPPGDTLGERVREGHRAVRERWGTGATRAAWIAVFVVVAGGLAIWILPKLQGPPPDHYLLGTYYPNPRWEGRPALVRSDRQIDFDFSPGHERPVEGAFSVEWTGHLYAPETGDYKFFLDSDDGSFLHIDGNLVIDNDGIHGMRQIIRTWFLERGTHTVRVRYFDSGLGEAGVNLAWRVPSGSFKRTIPVEAFTPGAEETYRRALVHHARGELEEAHTLYDRIFGVRSRGVDLAASANTRRVLDGEPPLATGLRWSGAAGSTAEGIGLLDPSMHEVLEALGSEEGGSHGRDLALEGYLWVPEAGTYRLASTATFERSLSIDGGTAAIQRAGIEEVGLDLGEGAHAIEIRSLGPVDDAHLDLAWSLGEESPLRAVPRALFTTSRPENPRETAAVLWAAAEEVASSGNLGDAARWLARIPSIDPAQERPVRERLERLLFRGWSVRAFDNTGAEGEPVIERFDPDGPWADFDRQRPLPGAFSMEWTTRLEIDDEGPYTFSLTSDDGSFLYVDDRLVVDNGGVHGMTRREGMIRLESGGHRVRVRYFDSGFGAAGVRLRWKPPGRLFEERLPRGRMLRAEMQGRGDLLFALGNLFHFFGHTEQAAPLYEEALREGGLLERQSAERCLADALAGRDLEAARAAFTRSILEGVSDRRFPAGRVLFDLESGRYAEWAVEGEAFGTAPSRGAIREQNELRYWEGRYLVNSFLGGSDEPTGSLLSAPFLLDRPLLSFLIGGSGHLETVRLELLVDGRVERAATGSFTEFLERRTWDVGDLAGREARLRAVDESSDEWGHLLLDDVRLHERLRR